MPNIFVAGSARSGSSLLAGMFAGTHHCGDELLPANHSNPKGYFEDAHFIGLNEELIHDVWQMPLRSPSGTEWCIETPRSGQKWMAVMGADTAATLAPGDNLRRRMVAHLSASPWCRKDPRLAWTLPAWRRVCGEVRILCVFREPAISVASMLEWARGRPIGLTKDGAFAIWQASYDSLLRQSQGSGEWCFVRYNDLVSGKSQARIEEFANVALDGSLVDRRLNRSVGVEVPPMSVSSTYSELMDRSS